MEHKSSYILRLFSFLGLIVILNGGCITEGDRLYEMGTTFPLDVQAGLNTLETHIFVIENIPTLYDITRDANGYSDEDLAGINSLTGTFRSRLTELNLDFIQSMEVHIIDSNDPTNRREAFFTNFIDLGAKTEIRLIPSLPDLQELLSMPSVDIEVQFLFRGFASANIEGQLDLSFVVFGEEE